MAVKRKLKRRALEKLEEHPTYFENNRDRMKCDEYLEQGFPIGSGIVEGACRNLVKDRMERTGMRWSPAQGRFTQVLDSSQVADLSYGRVLGVAL